MRRDSVSGNEHSAGGWSEAAPVRRGETVQPGGPCFLCAPREDWVYIHQDGFFSTVALGPLMDGYSIIASHCHLPSMLDLPPGMLASYKRVSSQVRDRILRIYGQPCIITEHGRVPVCDYYDDAANEIHCYHAHQLVFPGDIDLSRHFAQSAFQVWRFPTFEAAHSAAIEGEYLYYEDAAGSILVATARPRLPRQYFRMLVAEHLGLRERANWRNCPGDEQRLTQSADLLRGDGL